MIRGSLSALRTSPAPIIFCLFLWTLSFWGHGHGRQCSRQQLLAPGSSPALLGHVTCMGRLSRRQTRVQPLYSGGSEGMGFRQVPVPRPVVFPAAVPQGRGLVPQNFSVTDSMQSPRWEPQPCRIPESPAAPRAPPGPTAPPGAPFPASPGARVRTRAARALLQSAARCGPLAYSASGGPTHEIILTAKTSSKPSPDQVT